MNKYIKYDLDDAATQMRVAIMNAIHAIDSGECKEISLGKYISGTLLLECLEDSNCQRGDTNWKTPSGLSIDVTTRDTLEWILKVVDND